MDIKQQFEFSHTPDLTAAHIGINKWNWKTIQEKDGQTAKNIMRQHRYDVLPIQKNSRRIEKFFVTEEWNNYDFLNIEKVNHTNSIYYRLAFQDLVRKFVEEERHFYFLTNEKDVLGLVSLVNLNCQAVYNYLFHIISDIERSISDLLKAYIDQDQILSKFEESEDKHLQNVKNKFEESINLGKDNSIFEHMYLQTVGITLKKFVWLLPDEYKSINKFSSKFSPNGTYGKIRNKIMHPVRPILNDKGTISNIHELLQDYSRMSEILGQKVSK